MAKFSKPEKRCSYCKQPKNINFFPLGQWNRQGNSRICSLCIQNKKPKVPMKQRTAHWRRTMTAVVA
jgi:hypothetical protein